MFGKSLLVFTLLYTSTSSADDFFNLVLNSSSATDAMKIMRSSNKIDSVTGLILMQPALHTSVSEDWERMSTEQRSVKTTARTWRSSVRSALFSINDGILAFEGKFITFYDYMRECAGDLSNNETRDDFVTVLQDLNKELLTRKDEAAGTFNQLSVFNQSVTNHVTNVDTGLTNIESKHDGARQNIENRIAALNEEIERINAPVATVPSGARADDREKRANFTRVLDEKQQLEIQLANLEFNLNEARELQKNLKLLADNVNKTVNAVRRVNGAWNRLDRDYRTVIRNFESPFEGSVNVVQELEYAKLTWEELARRATEIKRTQLTNQPVASA